MSLGEAAAGCWLICASCELSEHRINCLCRRGGGVMSMGVGAVSEVSCLVTVNKRGRKSNEAARSSTLISPSRPAHAGGPLARTNHGPLYQVCHGALCLIDSDTLRGLHGSAKPSKSAVHANSALIAAIRGAAGPSVYRAVA